MPVGAVVRLPGLPGDRIMDGTLSSWSCRYEADGLCRKVDGAYCRPGMKGCILVGKVTFQDGVVPSPVWPPESGPPAREPGCDAPPHPGFTPPKP
jgi:hypothetical protein